MKKRKGSLLIAVTLLSVILLIIMMTILNLNRKNAELTQFQSDREKAFQAANIGLQKAVEDIEIQIEKYMNDKQVETVTWEILYGLSSNGKIAGNIAQDNNEKELYKYSSKYSNGQITATGTYKKSKVTLTANYAMDYMGISSNGINYIKDKTSVANVKSIYSYNTQYPMKTWINTDQSDGPLMNQNPISIPTDSILTYYNLLNNQDNRYSEAISNHYIIYNKPTYDNNPEIDTENDNTSEGTKETEETEETLLTQITESLGMIDNNGVINNTSDIMSKSSRDYIQELIKSLSIQSNGYIYASNKQQKFKLRQTMKNLNLSLFTSLCLKLYNKLSADPSIHSILDKNIDSEDININKKNIKELTAGDNGIYVLDQKVLDEDHFTNISESPFNYDYENKQYMGSISTSEKTKKNIYLCQGRNVIAIPINTTFVINGDLILAPEETNSEIEKFYGFNKDDANNGQPHKNSQNTSLTDKELNENYPVLFVTGNLVVNGNIRGTGTVFSMNSITINALPSKDDENDLIDPNRKDSKGNSYKSKYANYIGNKNIDNGAVIVHACNQLYIANKYSLDCLDNDQLRNKITASWILTQDRSIIEKASKYSTCFNNGRFSEGSSNYINQTTPTANLQISNALPLGVPKKSFSGISGITQISQVNKFMLAGARNDLTEVNPCDHRTTAADAPAVTPTRDSTSEGNRDWTPPPSGYPSGSGNGDRDEAPATTSSPKSTATNQQAGGDSQKSTTSPTKYEDAMVNGNYTDPRFKAPTPSPTPSPSPTQTSSIAPRGGAIERLNTGGEHSKVHLCQ